LRSHYAGRESRAGAGYMNQQFGSRRWIVAGDVVPGGPQVGAGAPVAAPRLPWVVLFAVIFAALCAYHWATAWPVKSLATFMMDQARALGLFLFVFALPGILARRSPFPDLRNFALPLAPFYLVELVPPVASTTVTWEGGWVLGIAGAAVGAAAGAVMGWLFKRWIMPEYDKRRARESTA